ncbi:MAG: hypothetical protein Q9192_001929 [Flavoplaca navasiana]
MLRDLADRSCRLQLKCGGQKTGCDRCKSARIQCTYSQDNGNNRRRSNNTATARHNNQPKAVNPPTSSSDTHNSAVQYSPPSRTVDSLARTGTDSRDGNAPHEEPPFSSASNAFDPFASFLSSTDDDSTVADTCLQDLLPELNPQGMDTRLDSPGFSIQSTFSDCDSYLKNLCSLPDPLEPPFDSLVLAKQQSALNNCLRMARCVSCAARSDYMILLGVVSDKLITSYEQVVMDKDAKLHAGTDNRDDQEGGKMACSVVSSGPISAAARDTRRKCAISFGCYQVDGTTEWEFVVKVLIVLQLRQVFILLAHMQSIAEGTSRDQHVSALRMRKQRLQTLTSRVRNSVKL